MDFNELITSVNDAVWGYVLIFALVGCGLWFTLKTRFVQFRMVGEMLRLLTDSAVDTVGDQVKEGQHVIFSKYAGSEVEIDGHKYTVVKQNDILAVVE